MIKSIREKLNNKKKPIKKDSINVKINGVYYAYDNHLKVGNKSPKSGHTILVTSINKKRKTARVKTITILGKYDSNKQKWIYKYDKIDDVCKGNILAIPINQLKSKNFSGIHHNSRTIKLDQIHYKNRTNKTIFPKRYSKLIHKK